MSQARAWQRTLPGLVLLMCFGATLLSGVVTAALPAAAVAEGGGAAVVRELVDKRTEYAKAYLLSDGSFRSICYQSPIH